MVQRGQPDALATLFESRSTMYSNDSSFSARHGQSTVMVLKSVRISEGSQL
jgi:hypothetical protein